MNSYPAKEFSINCSEIKIVQNNDNRICYIVLKINMWYYYFLYAQFFLSEASTRTLPSLTQGYSSHNEVNEATGTNSLGKRTRRLFHKVPYTAFENEKISEFRDYASSKGIALDCENNQILRYLYTGDFNF